jgi:hypothetical protein
MSDEKDDKLEIDPDQIALIEALLAAPDGLHQPAGVDIEPVIETDGWRIYAVPFQGNTEHHVSGFDRINVEGRMSSPIQAFDPKARTVTTRSGRLYKLTERTDVGISEMGDIDYVLGAWLSLHGVKKDAIQDVTDEYLSKINEA